ncbi:predicted protein [Naegleria gruberi]|uniref:Predicted protein n=1 Tax=Naegleria gruberi TaxID=5762 RepID=D2VAN7_NAEGR|nr:uncharacterized protein NAEGRDRAFT_47999 [Naegleria gruberi]EFC46108.1 predicted protein [Naegleria gruberi]|eukprot:XP_002678852.1 predicted protein [Naegleria gruberi strain NEG-M]
MSKEEEELMKDMQKDVVWNAYLAEMEGYEDMVWTDAKRRGKELTGDDIDAIKEKIREKRKELAKKYKQMKKVYDQTGKLDTVQQPKAAGEEKKLYEDLAKVFKENAHFVDSPEFGSIKKEFEKRSGFSIPSGIHEEYSPEQIEQFMKMLDGEEGKEMEEYMNKILSDDVFAKLGINAEDFNPAKTGGFNLENLENMAMPAMHEPPKSKPISKEEFETFKHSMLSDIRKNQYGMEQFFLNETGQTFEGVMDDFYNVMKEQNVSNPDELFLKLREGANKKK